MTVTIEKFKKVIRDSKLSDAEKVDFYELFVSLPPYLMRETVKNVLKQPDSIYKIVENFRKKQEIIANQDKDGWQELLKEEEKELGKLAKEE